MGDGSVVDEVLGMTLGQQATGVGVVNLDGASTQMLVSGDGQIGLRGNGRMEVHNGATFRALDHLVPLGVETGSTGELNVSGSNSFFQIDSGPGNLWLVGDAGSGTVNISDQGRISSGYGILANDVGSFGRVHLTGEGANWTTYLGITVGQAGDGELVIENGATLFSNFGAAGTYIAREAGSTGKASVSGQNSLWRLGGFITVGSGGTGELEIHSGGSVQTGSGFVGGRDGGVGKLTITGQGSQWIGGSSGFTVGSEGEGEALVTDGGRLSLSGSLADLNIGGSVGGKGTLIVEGPDSVVDVSRNLFIGGRFVGGSPPGPQSGGEGTLIIRDGATVNIGGEMRLFGDGHLVLESGLLQITRINLFASSGQFSQLGGTLSVDTIWGDFVFSEGQLTSSFLDSRLEIDGDFELGADATLYLNLRGTGANAYDTVEIDGDGIIDGTVLIDLDDGFSPTLGTVFNLIDADSFAGDTQFQFTGGPLAAGLTWDTTHFFTNGTVSIAAVPEPSGIAMLMLVAAGLASRRRRR
ncbi:MAG: PEP-CTERM sorting domain-containing protein [Planctomycetota bacterium]